MWAKIIIPSTITEIVPTIELYSKSFRKCIKNTDIVLPSTIKSIGEFSFEGCTSLNRITIPNSVKKK